jgi:SAM-dependent methyltransferase
MARKKRYGSFAVTVYRHIIDPILHPLRPKVVDVCREIGVRRVLDIASGTGAQCRMLGRSGFAATGIDLSEDMVELAIARGGRNVCHVQGSALDLPFEDGSFDACLLLLALHEHTEDERTRMLSEAVRVAGRCVLVADYEQPRHPAASLPWQVIRAVEISAGPEHRAGFEHFVGHGSLSGLLTRHLLTVRCERASHFRCIRLVAVDLPLTG